MMHGEIRPDPDDPARDPEGPQGEAREVDSRALFGDARMVVIRHGAELYTLRITRVGKLILTK